MGLFGKMVRKMGQERAYFFLVRMCERHNRRNIGDRILSMNEMAVLELCAAYKMEVSKGTPLDEVKRDLSAKLIAGEAPYDLEALDMHRATVLGRAPIISK